MNASFEQIVSKLSSGELYDFPGGVHPQDKKSISNQDVIRRAPLPEKLIIPVRQHVGTEGRLAVSVGDHVMKGQPLTRSSHPFAIPVHAPTSGTVTDIGQHITAHPSGLREQAIVIQPDGEETWTTLTPLSDYASREPANVVEALCDAGISGMGGAGFPTHIKASGTKKIEFIVINGVECEPYITADDRLMREHAWQIRQGADVLSHLVKPQLIIVAIEDNKPEALDAMKIACKDNPDIQVVSVPTKYPAGGEKQLIQVLTGREVPRDGLPADIGVLMFNVGTCYAIADAIFHGKPLIERVVTLTGGAVEKPGNVWALIGTPVNHLLGEAQYNSRKQKDPQVVMGGPMMGFTLNDAAVPVVKITNCLLVPANGELIDDTSERPCIRCSACADACPATLLPQQLFWHSKAHEYEKAQEYNLFDCIECGACAYVCPSEIPLVHYYRQAKSAIRQQRDEKARAEKAKERFEARKARLEREKIEREEKHKRAKEARAKTASAGAPKDKVAAALARAKSKRAEETSTTPENDTSQSDKQAKVAAAVARAKARKIGQSPQQTDAEQIQQASMPAADGQTVDSDISDKQKRVAAAVARAKAKKAQRGNPDAAESVDSQTGSASQQDEGSSETGTAEDDKKKRVAAAVARAKAKKAQRENTDAAEPDDSKTETPSSQEAESSEAESAADEKEKRIAAAVARAKAKKAQREKTDAAEPVDSQTSSASPQDEGSSETGTAEDEKKKRVATAVARAKAKKARREKTDTAEPVDSQTETPSSQEAESSEAESAADEKQKRIAAAVARAKAKKAQRDKQNENNS
ncbi:electron transport complex subunit RsxC [Salinimonas iocasae]|uniref:Ion-translocating oxidoreductase complex subunit C n=1 Tax=Salinimonas iocasae TaxID=2572577 RepID=A0A5B7YIF1_9ALTE|nr:electron transport complex subunit RsxC [Salinimonas iocasae]QCZ95226.1 electron transport complex subunit RsxC [Salinimonas iocasae]